MFSVVEAETLRALASDFQIYLQSKPDARLTLLRPRRSAWFCGIQSGAFGTACRAYPALLVELGVPAANIQTEAFGKQQNLTDPARMRGRRKIEEQWRGVFWKEKRAPSENEGCPKC